MRSFLAFFLLLPLAASGLPQANRQPGLFGGSKQDKKEDENTRSVQGVVRGMDDDPVEGAVVQLKDTKSLRVRSFITKTDGTYQFHGLSTEVDYELKARHKDLASDIKRLSVFDSRRKAVINLQLETKE